MPNGDILYWADSSNWPGGSPLGLFVLDTATGVSKLISTELGGPIDVASDGRIAGGIGPYGLAILDTAGRELWHRETGLRVGTLDFGPQENDLYFCVTLEHGPDAIIGLLHTTLAETTGLETTLFDAGYGHLSPDGSQFVYQGDGDEEQPVAYFRRSLPDGEPELLFRSDYTAGFCINPVHPEWLAVGVRGDGRHQLMGRRILLYNMDTGESVTYEAAPEENCDVSVRCWSPDGRDVLIWVGPYKRGDPIRPLFSEVWVARDVLRGRL